MHLKACLLADDYSLAGKTLTRESLACETTGAQREGYVPVWPW